MKWQRMPQTPEEKREKARWSRILKVYGLTREQYDVLDNGNCPICLRTWSESVRPCVDHDHTTGEVRGIICLYCNHRVVGRHRDANVMRRVAEYLDGPYSGLIVPKAPKKKRKKRAT